MTDQRLYIDGVLMDISPNTAVTLDIKSNLFRSIADTASNSTYTIKLPKTVHNMAVLGNIGVVKSGTDIPYILHSCRYLRNGVEIIRNGSVYVLKSTATAVEISVTWGAMEVLSDINDKNRSIADLRTTDSLPYADVNKEDTYDKAMERGYFYSFYNAFQYRETDDWRAKSYKNTEEKSDTIDTSKGAIITGNGLGVELKQEIDDSYADYECARLKVQTGDSVILDNIATTDEDIRAYAILNEKGKVIALAPKGDGTMKSYTLTMPTDSRTLIVNSKKGTESKEILIIKTTTAPEDLVSNVRDGRTYFLPSVSANYILGKIKDTFGLSVIFNDADVKENVSTLALPLVTANPGDTISNQLKATFFRTSLDWTSVGKEILLSVSTLNDFLDEKEQDGKTVLEVLKDTSAVFDIQVRYKFTTYNMQNEDYDEYNYNYLYLSVVVEDSKGDKKGHTTENGTESQGTIDLSEMTSDKCGYYTMCGSGKISLKKGDKVTFFLGGQIVDEVRAEQSPDLIMDAQVEYSSINVNTDIDKVQRGGTFPIKQNLPDVSVMDFLKTLQVLTGTYVKQANKADTITYYSVDNLWHNRAKAVDWSRRLIAGSGENTPRTMQFKYSEFSRKNSYKWKDDQTNLQNHDGTFYINNDTLTGSKNIATLPFASSDDMRVPIYAPEEGNPGWDDYTAPEYKGCEPRIMRLKGDGAEHNSYLVFDDSLDLESVLDTQYRNIKNTLDKAKVITEYLYLSDIEILNFDESVPVYLAQYGAYFAVLEIKVNSKGYSEVTMIKIEFND